MWPFKKKETRTPVVSPSDFLSQSILLLHEEAIHFGFAKKGFIFHEGLLQIGNSFIFEGMKTQPDLYNRNNSFYLSLAASNLQMGFVFARQACIDKNSILSGSFFDTHESVESIYKELIIGLKTDLGVTIEEWESFRQHIIPLWIEIIKPYKNHVDEEQYNMKLMVAYYMLGVSIGLEKYEL